MVKPIKEKLFAACVRAPTYPRSYVAADFDCESFEDPDAEGVHAKVARALPSIFAAVAKKSSKKKRSKIFLDGPASRRPAPAAISPKLELKDDAGFNFFPVDAAYLDDCPLLRCKCDHAEKSDLRNFHAGIYCESAIAAILASGAAAGKRAPRVRKFKVPVAVSPGKEIAFGERDSCSLKNSYVPRTPTPAACGDFTGIFGKAVSGLLEGATAVCSVGQAVKTTTAGPYPVN